MHVLGITCSSVTGVTCDMPLPVTELLDTRAENQHLLICAPIPHTIIGFHPTNTMHITYMSCIPILLWGVGLKQHDSWVGKGAGRAAAMVRVTEEWVAPMVFIMLEGHPCRGTHLALHVGP